MSRWLCSHTVQAPEKPKPLRSHSMASNLDGPPARGTAPACLRNDGCATPLVLYGYPGDLTMKLTKEGAKAMAKAWAGPKAEKPPKDQPAKKQG